MRVWVAPSRLCFPRSRRERLGVSPGSRKFFMRKGKLKSTAKRRKNTMAVHFSSKSDEWATPQELFDQLSKKYGPFDLDVCATHKNAKCRLYITEQGLFNKTDTIRTYPLPVEKVGEGFIWRASGNGLDCGWTLQRGFGEPEPKCWMNPPYGREIRKWVQKASDESKKGCTVVCLLPARLGSKWMRELIKTPLVNSKKLRGWTDELGDWIEGDNITVGELAGRVKFGGCESAAPFPSMVVVFRPPGARKC